MHEDGKRDAFDKLVAGLNTEDRNIMLSKLNANKTQTVKFVNMITRKPRKNGFLAFFP